MKTKLGSFKKIIEVKYHCKNVASSKNKKDLGDFSGKVFFILWVVTVLFSVVNNGIYAQNIIKNDSIKPFINFLENNNFLSAKEYTLSKFETYDIVVLSERFHHDMSQYDVILDIIKDNRFKGHIYTEIGHTNLYERFNNFLMNSTFTEEEKQEELMNLYRDISPSVIWDPYNYYHLLNEVWNLNKNKKNEDKILIFPLDIPLDWNDIQTHRELSIHYNFYNGLLRDQVIGMNFVELYEARKNKKKKALVILNSTHGYKQNIKYKPLPTRPLIRRTGEFINKTYPDKTFTIYINSCNIDNSKLSNNGIIDASFEFSKKDNIGFDLKDTPIGKAKFDLYFTYNSEDWDTNINYNYIFDGMIFYKPLKEMVIKSGIPNIYPKEYEEMFFKRISLVSGMKLEEVKNNKEFIELLKRINTPRKLSINEYLGEGLESLWDNQIKKWIE